MLFKHIINEIISINKRVTLNIIESGLFAAWTVPDWNIIENTSIYIKKVFVYLIFNFIFILICFPYYNKYKNLYLKHKSNSLIFCIKNKPLVPIHKLNAAHLSFYQIKY